MLAAIQLAQQAGFSMAEIHELYYGFSETTPDERWRHLAERKLKEVETMIAHAQAMRKMLHAFLHCGCARLEECVAAEQIGHDAEPDAT
jgi:DNA-binding transcriptional MerR regulator